MRDEQGRKRLHGAFTGGFSAGYFNTVGSAEGMYSMTNAWQWLTVGFAGWQPSTFTSSRNAKASVQARKPEDFMDDEDIAELADSKRLATRDEFDILGGTERELETKKKTALEQIPSAIGPLTGKIVQDLIIPAKFSVGAKLLRHMGWREGQGIGPRVKRSSDVNDPHAENYTVAPKDVEVISFEIKTDHHGLGYHPFSDAPELEARQRKAKFSAEVTSRGKTESKGGSFGGSFGVGMFEEEDDDIYGSQSMDQYDVATKGHQAASRDSSFTSGSSLKKRKHEAELEDIPQFCSDGRLPLSGFLLAIKRTILDKMYPFYTFESLHC